MAFYPSFFLNYFLIVTYESEGLNKNLVKTWPHKRKDCPCPL
ncbi:hypothetical protein HMPREF1246_1431 [Acidaminococcus sp. BV3L6]|nr:hypothetical protein HMPREF1246_1431 [Acidaminococcus sp. BV3L6]